MFEETERFDVDVPPRGDIFGLLDDDADTQEGKRCVYGLLLRLH